ncbi:MAG: leucine-rich repeat domain-containing protein [Treponema sp.]|nr:leucine-rich repeat domain-containing protein [Treponema sp.]
MRVNFRFFNFTVWGSTALLFLVFSACSPLAGTDLTEPVSGPPIRELPEHEDGTEDPRDSGEEQETPENGDGGNTGEEPGGEPGEEPGGGNETGQTPIPGTLSIRIGGIENPEEGAYPNLSGITQYRLDFSGEDGKTAESRYLDADEELALVLDAGEWEIHAYGLLEKGAGQPPLEVIYGTDRVIIPEDGAETLVLVPDTPVTESGEPGFLSWNIEYPGEKVWGAVLMVSARISGGDFIPYAYVDLTGAGAETQKISLPVGTYRMESRFLSHHVDTGSAELVHIYPGLETGSVNISAAAFPEPREFSSTGELKVYLDGLPENTVANPYPVKITGVDLSISTKTGETGETLKTLYDVLNRYVTLDLRECTGTNLIAASTSRLANRVNIVSLILPDSVTEINSNGFSGYESLKSAVLPRVSKINTSVFKNCGQLETVFAPALETVVDANDNASGAFAGCIALKTLYVPRLTALGKYAVYGCTSLTGIFLPNVLTVGGLAFRRCTALKSVSLPSLTKIDSGAFEEDTALSYLVFGSTPPELETNVFRSTSFSQTGVIFVPPDAADTYKNTALPNWSGLKELVKPLPGPLVP